MSVIPPRLFLCAGLQSSGSTLISWCFLQRPDLDGVLDGDNDVLPETFAVRTRDVWFKTTISPFRLSEMAAHFSEQGWDVRPLLVSRDVRSVYASLVRKPYGRNGTTAEDPPLRLRLRRFREDWEHCRRVGWPILSYERFVEAPEQSLRDACGALGLDWRPAMLSWPKPLAEIADTRHGNDTFHASRGHGLLGSLRRPSPPSARGIPAGELAWLETEFRDFNAAEGHPLSVGAAQAGAAQADGPVNVPRFEVTRRRKWFLQRNPVRRVLLKFGVGAPSADRKAA